MDSEEFRGAVYKHGLPHAIYYDIGIGDIEDDPALALLTARAAEAIMKVDQYLYDIKRWWVVEPNFYFQPDLFPKKGNK